jgi:LysM repeat protein
MLSFVKAIIDSSVEVSTAAVSSFNSQTIPLLQPAVNIDPNPAKGGGDITVVDNSALYADQGPEGTVADTQDTPPSSQISIYTVRTGDSLSSIAHMFNVTTNTIVWANDIQGGVIQPGQQLVILPITGIRHTVTQGETLQSITKKYKGDASEIAQYNGIASDGALTVGTVIIIPDGELNSSIKPAASASNPHATAIKNIALGKKTEPYLGGSGPAIPGYFTWPMIGGVITQGLHGWNAVDIGAPKGTPILASASGIVIVAKSNGAWNGGYGNYVVLQHDNGTQTLYAHASSVSVTVGDQVSQGQTIARVGMTGEATGPHLHFEVRGALNPFAN